MSDSFPHLDALFALAQVLTLDAARAEHLLEKTYLQALQMADHRETVLEDRRHMMRLLIRIHKEQATTGSALPEKTAAGTSRAESFKKRVLDQFLLKAAPTAFATLGDADRLLLSLCHIENMSCADAALILSEPLESTCARLEEVRARFRHILLRGASPAEAQLLKDMSPDDWGGEALRKALHSEFAALPPTLEPRLKSALNARQPATVHATGQSPSTRDRLPAPSQPRRKRTSKGLATLLLILTAGMAGYLGSSLLSREPESNLITLSAEKAPRVETILETSSYEEAEQFVRRQMNWRLTLPQISESELAGVGISEIARQVRVPVFLYHDLHNEREEPIAVYVYTYALLDQFSDRIVLERDILAAISSEDHFDIHDLSDRQKVLIWRNANDIFMAVTSLDARELRQRIETGA